MGSIGSYGAYKNINCAVDACDALYYCNNITVMITFIEIYMYGLEAGGMLEFTWDQFEIDISLIVFKISL